MRLRTLFFSVGSLRTHQETVNSNKDRWWPNATWEDLYTAMLFTVCLFIWDDIIDTNEHALASDFEEASTWRKDSLAYFKYHLQLCPQDQAEPYCPDSICILFKAFGERFCRSFGHGKRYPVEVTGRMVFLVKADFLFVAHRLRMFTKIEQFVQHNEMEQAERLNGQMPNYEHYLHVRFGVTGVRMFSLLLEYVHIRFNSGSAIRSHNTCGSLSVIMRSKLTKLTGSRTNLPCPRGSWTRKK